MPSVPRIQRYNFSRLCFGLLLLAARASALPAWLDPYGKVEAGVAFPAKSPQSDFFGAGFGGRLNAGIGFHGWFSVQLTAELAALPARGAAPSTDPALPLGLGGGLRVQLPYRGYAVSPWLDGDVLYVRTGSLDRFGYSIGLGLHIPVGAQKMVRVGPFVRVFQILDTDAPHVNSGDAVMVMAGASLEVGSAQAEHHEVVRDEVDSDGDGVADRVDRCPNQPGPAAAGGCPDRDRDGVPDKIDLCPDQAGPDTTGGCPDQDGDGVPDKSDKCPSQKGPLSTGGCPDQDGDGIADADDKCPAQPGPAKTGGCPDQDGDGVPDKDDKCPTEAGAPEQGGCPAVAPKVEVKVEEKKLALNQKIYFDTGSSRIQPRSFGILDEVAKALAEHPSLKIRIEGNTDNVIPQGATNKQLSEWRAGAVKQYLVEHGVDGKRLRTKGWGDTRPVAPNDDEEGREKNRRVEFVITGGEK